MVLASVLLFTTDLGVFKPQIEAWVSDKTGRELRIDGALVVQLGSDGLVFAENLRFANPDWADQAQMVEVGELQLRFEFWSVFGKRFIIDSFDIAATRVHLQKGEDGEANWALNGDSESASDGGDGLDGLLTLVIDSLSQQRSDDDNLAFSLAGSAGGRSIALGGRAGTWAALLDGANVEFDLEGTLDTVTLSSEGRIDSLGKPFRPSLEFSLVGPDIDDLAAMFGLGDEANGTIDLRGSLTPTADGPLTLTAAGNVGETRLQASGRFSDLQNTEEMDLDLLVSGPSLGKILRWFGQPNIRDAPYMIDINASRRGRLLAVEQAEMVFGQAQLNLTANLPNFPQLDDATIDLNAAGPDIQHLWYLLRLPGGIAEGAFSMSFDVAVSPRGEESFRLSAETNLGSVDASGMLGAAPEYFGTDVDFELTAGNLSDFGDALGLAKLPDRPLQFTGELEYTRDGLRTVKPLVASVNDVFANVQGLIVPVAGLLGTATEFTLTGPDLAALAGAFGADSGVPNEPYVIAGELQVVADGYRFRKASGNIGSSLISVDGLISRRSGLSGTRMDISAEGPAFEEMIDGVGDLEVAPGPYSLSGSLRLDDDALVLRSLELDRGAGDLRLDLTLGLPVETSRSQFAVRGNGTDIRNLVKGRGRFAANEAPFQLDAAGEWQGADWSIERFGATVGDAEISANGRLRFDDNAAASRFEIIGNIPSLATLGTIDGRRLRDQPLSWEGTVADGGNGLELDLLVRLANSDINGNVIYRAGEIPAIEIDLQSTSLIIAPLLEAQEQEYDPEPEFADGRLIPDVVVPFETLRAFDASLRLDIAELRRDTLHMKDIGVVASLSEGQLTVSDFGIDGRAGRFDARAALLTAGTSASASVEIVARGFAFGASELNQDLKMTGDLDINLDATGANLRELMGNMNGVFFVDTRGGRVANNRFLQALFGDVLDEVIGTINPFFKREEFTDLVCVVLPVNIADGVATSDPNSLLSTDKVRIATTGAIDLKTEKIDLNVRTTPKKSISISAGEFVNPYVKIVDTLSKPRLAVDEKGVLVSGSAAVATGGLSILARAAWTRLSRADDPCADTADQAKKALGDRFPDWAPAETVESQR